MIISGLIGGSFLREILHEMHIYGALIYLPIVLTVIGGMCTFRREHWRWAFAGAICSLIFPILGIPALILLLKRKSEFE